MRITPLQTSPADPSRIEYPGRTPSRNILRPIIVALAGFVVVGGVALGIALFAGAMLLFNILVFTMFTVLWIAFAMALAFSPATLDDTWRLTRQLPLVVQAVVWLLLLPLMIGLWIWERSWSLPVRVVLVLGLGLANIFVFIPRGL